MLAKLKILLRRRSLLSNVLMLAGGTAAGQGVVVLASPLLTRLYAPEDFGVLTIYSSLLSVPVVVASLRYELAIPLTEKDEDAAGLLVLSLGIVLLMSLVMGLGVWLIGDQITSWANALALQPHLWLFPLGMGMVGTYQALNYWAVRKRAFFHIAQTKLSQSMGMILTQILLGLLRIGPLGLLVGDIVGRAAGNTTLATLALRESEGVLKALSLGKIRQLAIRYRRFPLLASFSGLINSAGLQLPALFLAAFYGPQVAGWFALGPRVIGVPMSLVGQAVAQVYVGEAARLAMESPVSPLLRFLFLKTAGRLLLVGIAPLAILALGGSGLFAWIFGDSWQEAGVYMQILALMFLTQFVVVPLSQTLNVLERQSWQLGWDIGRLLLVMGTLLVARTLGWLPSWAIAAYGIAMLISYITLFGLSLHALLLGKVSHAS